MLERTMKTFGATAVFLAVINLLTVSSDIINDANSTSSQATDLQDPRITLASTPVIPDNQENKGPIHPTTFTEPENPGRSIITDQTTPKTGTTPSVILEKAASTSTSRSRIISTVSTPTEEISNVSISTDLNKDVNASSAAYEKALSAPTKKEEVPSKETSTIPSGEQQNPTINDEVPSKEPSTRPSVGPRIKAIPNAEDSIDPDSSKSSGDAEKVTIYNDHDSSKSSGGAEKISATSNKGIKIGAGCVAAVIAVIVLVVIYKICQKKPPAAENPEEKACAETKENVTLISVKKDTPNPDMKRTSSNQMESIEC